MSWFKRKQEARASKSPSPQRTMVTVSRNPNATQPPGAKRELSPQEVQRNADPDTRLEVFKYHWLQAVTIMNKTNMASAGAKRGNMVEEIDAVTHYIDQMMLLLVEDSGDNNQQGPVLQYTLAEDILEKILTWSSRTGEHVDRLKLHQLKLYDMLMGQAMQPLLIHKPIVRPLLKLLSSCAEHSNKVIEKHLILLLHQLCVCLTQRAQLVELMFDASSDHGPAKFLMFSLLIPYVHREGPIGQQARDALLLIMSLSSANENIGIYIAENSDFCPVLATGLSGLYSSLPRKLNIPSDDWYQLDDEDIQNMPDLIQFLNSLEFCNAVVQVSHPLVRDQLLTFIYNGFLVPVIGPALHQNEIIVPGAKSGVNHQLSNEDDSLFDGEDDSFEDDEDFDDDVDIFKLPIPLLESYFASSVEEVIAATAYLELFIRKITEPCLMQTFLKFVLVATHDDHNILESLISRINSTSRLCMVSLSLFRTLVDLDCEDVMFQLVFKYLIPCTHVMVSQRRSVKDIDLYGKTAEKFFSLIPGCCIPDISDTPSDTSDNPRAPDSPSSNSSSLDDASQKHSEKENVNQSTTVETNPSNLEQTTVIVANDTFIQGQKVTKRATKYYYKPKSQRKTRASSEAACLDMESRSSSPDVLSLNSLPGSYGSRLEHFETSYIEYLDAAREKLLECGKACSCWSAPYDGDNPSPDSLLRSAEDSALEDSFTGGELLGKGKKKSEKILQNGVIDNKECQNSINPSKKLTIEQSNVNSSDSNTGKSTTKTSPSKATYNSADQVTENGNVPPSDQHENHHESGNDTPPEKTSSPVNCDNSSDLGSFMLYLKRMKTPNEFCDNIEDSISEIDSLISELRHHEKSRSCSCPETPPMLTDISNSDLPKPEPVHAEDKPGPSISRGSTSLESSSGSSLGMKTGDDTTGSNVPSLASSKSNFTPLKYKLGPPNIGPFLTNLLNKLETMMQNSLYVNLLLTGVIARMACYPQPLIRSFLLNHSLVFQPTVKSLVQVLSSVKHKVDCYSYTVKDFEGLLLKARRFLYWREEVLLQSLGGRPRSESSQSLQSRQVPEPMKEKRRGSALGDFLFRRSQTKEKSKTQSKLQHMGDGRFRFINRTSSEVGTANDNLESVKTKNAVYCALVLEEFLKELAALSQEHSVLVMEEVEET